MNPEKQRIAIAEVMGWKVDHKFQHCDTYYRVTKPSGAFACDWFTQNALGYLPDYLNDLIAMHEAERTLDVTCQDFYLDWLIKITGNQYPIFATAAQRAEAFLRTIGKWEESA